MDTKDIPPTIRARTEKYSELLDKIPTGKTAQITDTNNTTIQSIKNYITNQHRHQRLLNIKMTQRTIPDRTTTPPTKTTYLYITKEP